MVLGLFTWLFFSTPIKSYAKKSKVNIKRFISHFLVFKSYLLFYPMNSIDVGFFVDEFFLKIINGFIKFPGY